MPLPLLLAGGIAVAGGLAKTISGASQAKKYQKLIDNYKRQKLVNPYENLKVSTIGAMLQQRNSAQNTATALYNLRQSGVNAILGGTSRVVEQNNQANQKIGAELDMQQNRNEYMKAQGQGMVMQMQEQREQEDLAGLGNAMNVGKQAMWGGLSDIAQGGMVAMGAFGEATPRPSLTKLSGQQIGINKMLNGNPLPSTRYVAPLPTLDALPRDRKPTVTYLDDNYYWDTNPNPLNIQRK